MDRYVAITIGPILDTLNLASSPASLWASSYLFSYLAKTLCRLLVTAGIPVEDIITPYYDPTEDHIDSNGVGSYPDRIIFREGSFDIKQFGAIRKEAINHLSQVFCVDEKYLEEYLLIAAAAGEATNPILDMGKVLDSLELAKPIVKGWTSNPLMQLLVGEKNYGNEAVKALPLVKGFQNWQLRRSPTALKSISDIAGSTVMNNLKKHSYIAVVRADGDHMGDVIKGLPEAQLRDFSHNCLNYCTGIANIVGKYGGVTIYSGGDDLLALLPCENAEGQTVFELIQDANEHFKKYFEQYNVPVSLSFGVTMCYHKFPLYEALDDSYTMLKTAKDCGRSCTAIHLQKHAGQSDGLIIPHKDLEGFIELMAKCVFRNDSEWLHSVHHKLNQFRRMFDSANNEDAIYNLFANLFDAEAHQNNDLIHKILPTYLCGIKKGNAITVIEAAKDHKPVDTLCYLLRMFQFFVEKGGDKE